MSISRNDIVVEARSWVGTKFHHQGRTKKLTHDRGGCDCIGLILGVCNELKIKLNNRLVKELDVLSYPRIPDGVQLQAMLERYLVPIDASDIVMGDILLFKFEKEPQHVAIVSDYPLEGELGIIHAYAQSRKVVEHVLDKPWKERVVAAYSLDIFV